MRILFLLFFASVPIFSAAQEVPQTFAEAWENYDPRAEPLEVEVIREVVEEDIVIRTIRYVVGTFDGRKTKVAAFYAFPKGAEKLPGLIQVHGGGQFARKGTAKYWASRGYAVVTVNWGEKVIDQPDDPNADWTGIPAGFLDPKHHNDVTPGDGTIHDVPHPWNSSWLLYSAAARRAITLLEEQPEADGDRVGLMGHSMGGRITMLTANDPRLKAISPSVGGSGFLYTDIVGIPNSARRMVENRKLYLDTIDCAHAWPLASCPVMFLGATNDFNSPMEFVVRGFKSLPKNDSAMSFTPHMNHRFTADNYMARILWFDAHLKSDFTFPKMPRGELKIKTESGTPEFTVKPDFSTAHKIEKVVVYYGFDRDPRARFWRSAETIQNGDHFTAQCPVMDLGEPLFAFANVTYDTGEKIDMPPGYLDNSLLTLTSDCRIVYPEHLVAANVKPTGQRKRLIEDFANGWQDWSLVGVNHGAHWNYETHKVNDPAFVGPRGASLAFEIETTGPNESLAVIMDVDRWRGYTGRKPRRFTALIELETAGAHSITIPCNNFITEDGEALENYDFVTSLILTPAQKERPKEFKAEWKSDVPVFKNIRWEGGEFADRPRPYLKSGESEIDADAAFRDTFDNAVDESVEREAQDRK